MGRFEPFLSMKGKPVSVRSIHGERAMMPGKLHEVNLPLGLLLYGLHLRVRPFLDRIGEESELHDIALRVWRGPQLVIHQEYTNLASLREHNRAFGLPGGNRLFFCADGESALDTGLGFSRLSVAFEPEELCRVRVDSIEIAKFGRG